MTERMTASEFHDRADLDDWRVTLDRLEATFVAGSFAAAASFLQQIAGAAEAANHHPDVDLRFPGRVHLTVRTHAVNGLTSADAELATTISALASRAGMVGDPRVATSVEVAIDAIDIEGVRPFWKAVLGYVEEPGTGGEEDVVLVDPLRIGPPFWFQQMDAPRPQRNRIHIDVTVPHDVAEERVAAAIEAGGRLVTDRFARSFWVLADAEGNEACVCTWQDRD